MRPLYLKLLSMTSLILIFMVSLAAATEEITIISKDQLKEKLGQEDVAIIDVRATNDWDSSQFKIQGAQRQLPLETKEWMNTYPKDETIILYCA